MLQINENKGFHLKFQNGLTISVQFGSGNYCENRNYGDYGSEAKRRLNKCENAEIAIWDENNKWFDFGEETVKGWVSADDVAEWIYKTKNALDIYNIK